MNAANDGPVGFCFSAKQEPVFDIWRYLVPFSLNNKMVIAVSSRALFNLDDANAVFESEGESAYRAYQLKRLKTAAEPGVALPLVRKMLRFNTPAEHRVEVVVLSRNDPVSGLRVFHSAKEHGLDVTRGAFTSGRPPFPYLRPFKAVLFLSAHPDDVEGALCGRCPAATVYTNPHKPVADYPDEVRIAFDGDAVLFDDSSEALFRAEGLARFQESEAENAAIPLPPGPFQPFIQMLHALQRNPPASADMRIRTALITARNAPAHERAIRTLMDWNIAVDEALFLGGVEKKGFLEEFQPDFFFDDQRLHCDPASEVASTGHVPVGVANLVPVGLTS
jgi:5'-nucleotidase